MTGPITRRGLIAGAAGSALITTAMAGPAELPERPSLLIGGPNGSVADRWADALSEQLMRGLQTGHALSTVNIGGADGVTAANQFYARTAPDGATALLVGGAAPLAWLTGDTRVRFDVGRWTPLWGCVTSTMVISRGALTPGRPARVGVRNVAGPDLAMLLAMESLGHEVTPVPLDEQTGSKLARQDVDVLLLSGPELRTSVAALAAQGWVRAFGFGMPVSENEVVRDPRYPDLPTADELIDRAGRRRSADMDIAFRAVSAAAMLDAVLVLPSQTPAAAVAWWRHGCAGLNVVPAVATLAQDHAARPLSAGSAAATIQNVSVDASVLLALRRWMADRFRWQPN